MLHSLFYVSNQCLALYVFLQLGIEGLSYYGLAAALEICTHFCCCQQRARNFKMILI